MTTKKNKYVRISSYSLVLHPSIILGHVPSVDARDDYWYLYRHTYSYVGTQYWRTDKTWGGPPVKEFKSASAAINATRTKVFVERS